MLGFLAPFTLPSLFFTSLPGLGELKHDEKFYSAVSWPEDKEDRSLGGKTVPEGLTTEKYFSCPAVKASRSPHKHGRGYWMCSWSSAPAGGGGRGQSEDGLLDGQTALVIPHAHVSVTIWLAVCPRR